MAEVTRTGAGTRVYIKCAEGWLQMPPRKHLSAEERALEFVSSKSLDNAAYLCLSPTDWRSWSFADALMMRNEIIALAFHTEGPNDG